MESQFQASTDSLDSAEDFQPVEINLGEMKTMLSMYTKHKISVSSLTSGAGKMWRDLKLVTWNLTFKHKYCKMFYHFLPSNVYINKNQNTIKMYKTRRETRIRPAYEQSYMDGRLLLKIVNFHWTYHTIFQSWDPLLRFSFFLLILKSIHERG